MVMKTKEESKNKEKSAFWLVLFELLYGVDEPLKGAITFFIASVLFKLIFWLMRVTVYDDVIIAILETVCVYGFLLISAGFLSFVVACIVIEIIRKQYFYYRSK